MRGKERIGVGQDRSDADLYDKSFQKKQWWWIGQTLTDLTKLFKKKRWIMQERLHAITLCEFMCPCFHYVKKRLGLDCTYQSFMKLVSDTEYSDGYEYEIGDVLVWKTCNPFNVQNAALTITYAGSIIEHNVNVQYHFGVVEEGLVVSDLTVENCKTRIRTRFIDEVANPVFIKRYCDIKAVNTIWKDWR